MQKNQNKFYDGQNRCRRCNRPLSDPNDLYGWRCAQILGLNKYKEISSMLDDVSLKAYNSYVSTYLAKYNKAFEKISDIGKNVLHNITEKVKKWAKDKSIETWDNLMVGLKIFGDAVSDIEWQKILQRAFWNCGSEMFLRDKKAFYTSAWMLEHSLQDNPSDIWRGNDSRIAYLMNHDKAYLEALDSVIEEAEKENINWINNKKISVKFKTGDLYLSIHRMNINFNGYKRDDGKWIINAHGEDWYDFTEITSFMGEEKYEWSREIGLGTVANDVAMISQLTGAIQPYYVTVDFWTTR